MRKTKRIVPILLLAVLLVASIFLLTDLQTTSGQATNTKQVVHIEDQNLTAQAIAKYRTTTLDGSTYDDQFAGIWYCDDNQLNIGIVGDVECASMDETRNPAVAYHVRQFSYNRKRQIFNAITDLIPKYSIIGVVVTHRNNRVEIELTNESYIAHIERYLLESALFEEGIVYFIIEENYGVTYVSGLSLHGGGGIASSDGRYGATIFSKALCNLTGRRGVITAEHFTRNRTNLICGISGQAIARERTAFSNSGTANAAFLPFNNANQWQFNSSATYFIHPNPQIHQTWRPSATDRNLVPRTYHIASRDQIREGARIVKFGEATGRTEGIIYQVGYSRGTPGFHDQIRLRADDGQIIAASGDSGAPVFLKDGYRYTKIAMIWGLPGQETIVHRDAFASKITNVVAALDVTILTDEQPMDVGMYHMNVVHTETNPAAGSNMYLFGNNTSFNVTLMVSDHTTRSFRFEGNGTSTTVSSPHFPALNGTFNFDFVNIGFWNSFFTIRAPRSVFNAMDPFLWHISLDASGNLRFTSMEIEITATNNRNMIAGRNISMVNPLHFSRIGNTNNAWVMLSARGRGFAGAITIPASTRVNGVPLQVTEIAGFHESLITEIIIPNSITVIREVAFLDTLNLTTVTFLPNSRLTTIGDRAFRLSAINNIHIPRSVTTIGDDAFASTFNLETVSFDADSQLRDIRHRAFAGSRLTEITIPRNIEFIRDEAFAYTRQLQSITIPYGRGLMLGRAVFRDWSVAHRNQTIYFQNRINPSIVLWHPQWDEGNRANVVWVHSSSSPGLRFHPIRRDWNSNEIVAYSVSAGTSLNYNNHIIIPNTWGGRPVTSISNDGFGNQTNLLSISIPRNVESIWFDAFRGSENLTTVYFSQDSRLTSIGERAFYGTGSLEHIEIPVGVRNIGRFAFAHSGLVSIIFEEGSRLEYIEEGAFAYTGSLLSIDIPYGVWRIGALAFADSISLIVITIPDSVTSIGCFAFDLSGIFNNTPYDSIVYADRWVVGHRGNLTEILELRANTVGVANSAFRGSFELEGIIIPYGVRTIGDNAFWNCTSLTYVQIPNTVTKIGNYAFFGCRSLESIVIPASVIRIGDGAFANCLLLRTIYLERVFSIPARTAPTILGNNVFGTNTNITIFVDVGSFLAYVAMNFEYRSFFGIIDSNFGGGVGTQDDPFIIYDKAHLVHLAYKVNNGFRYIGVHFKMTQDIYLNDTADWLDWGDTSSPANHWTPIGTVGDRIRPNNPFNGIFDGQGFAVRGIYINQPSEGYKGLFGFAVHAVIKNIRIEQSFIRGYNNIGGVVGKAYYTSIINSHNDGRIVGDASVGGIVGYAMGMPLFRSLIANSSNTGRIIGRAHVGGIAGQIDSTTIINSFNLGCVFGVYHVGGIAGFAWFVNHNILINNFNYGNIYGNEMVGGIGGNLAHATLINNFNGGIVQGEQIVARHLRGELIHNYSIDDFASCGDSIVATLNAIVTELILERLLFPIYCPISYGVIFTPFWWIVCVDFSMIKFDSYSDFDSMSIGIFYRLYTLNLAHNIEMVDYTTSSKTDDYCENFDCDELTKVKCRAIAMNITMLSYSNGNNKRITLIHIMFGIGVLAIVGVYFVLKFIIKKEVNKDEKNK